MTAASVLVGVLAMGARVASAQVRPLSSDIFLAPVTIEAGRPMIGRPINVLGGRPRPIDNPERPAGYNTTPSFTPDGRAILFTSTRDGGQSDVFRYDIASNATTRVTRIDGERQLSPMFTPDGTRISVIRVERDAVKIGRRRLPRDSTQRLATFALDGSDPKLLVPSVNPVSNYVWLDAANVVLFVPGRPGAVVRANVRTGHVDTLTRFIAGPFLGGALALLPDRSGVSYTRPVDTTTVLVAMRVPGAASRDVVALPTRWTTAVWLSSDLLLSSGNSRIVYWRKGARDWAAAGGAGATEVAGASGLALSPDKKWIAYVGIPYWCPSGSNFLFRAFAPGGTTGLELDAARPVPQECIVPEKR